MSSLSTRSLAVTLVMLVAAGLSAIATPRTKIAEAGPGIDLEAMIPTDLSGWTVDRSVVPIAPSPDQQALIEKTYDQTLSRTYVDNRGYRVMLSMAYGGSQNKHLNTHRPEICYPAQGFTLTKSTDDQLDVAGKTIPIRRVVAAQGLRNEPITYWLIVGDQPTSFGLQHRLATIKYGLTGRIPDGMLIRVSSIDPDETRAYRLQDAFIRTLISSVSEKDRNRLLGALGG